MGGGGLAKSSYVSISFVLVFIFIFLKKEEEVKNQKTKKDFFLFFCFVFCFLKKQDCETCIKKIPSSGVGLLADASSRFFVSGPTNKKKEEKGKMGQGKKRERKIKKKKRLVFFRCIKKGKNSFFCFF